MKLYQRKDWLYYHYRVIKLSTRQIAKKIDITHATILNWLKKFDIPIRSSGEAFHLAKGNFCQLSQKAREWIDGELLGDGSLLSRHNYSAKFRYGSKYLEYINYVSDTLNSFGMKQCGKILKKKDKQYGSYVYCYGCCDYAELLPIYKRWYPKRKKIVPRDIKLTPLTLRQWFIGDGCLHHPKKAKPYIQLSTNAFPIPDVKWLIKQLNKLNFKTTRSPSNNTIRISTHSTKEFLDYIGECPVECYQYKWDY